MQGHEAGRNDVQAVKDVKLGRGRQPTLDALVFVMLRCLRAFDPYSNENTGLGEVLSFEGSPSSVELWKASVVWGMREMGYEVGWPEGEEWLQENVKKMARGLLAKSLDCRGDVSAV